VQLAARIRLISAISFVGGLSLFSWAFVSWKSTGFTGGDLFILPLGIGLVFMILGISLFTQRDRPASPGAPDSEGERRDFPSKPFERLWHYANIGYVVAVFIAWAVAWMLGVDLRRWRHLELALGVVVALPFISVGLLGIYAGKISDEDGVHSRSRHPFIYWMLIGVWLSLGIGALVFSIVAFGT
jgi:hypothetical protein